MSESCGPLLLEWLRDLRDAGGQAVLEVTMPRGSGQIVVRDRSLRVARYRNVSGLAALFSLAIQGRSLRLIPEPSREGDIEISLERAVQELERVLADLADEPSEPSAEPRLAATTSTDPGPSAPAQWEGPRPSEAPAPSIAGPPPAELPPQPATEPFSRGSLGPAPRQLDRGAGLFELPAVGDRIGRCLVTQQIARGGSGRVYRALHDKLQVEVAIKILQADPKDDRLREEAKREARLLARLHHPNIIRILDFEDSGRFPYLVLEYVDGLTLAALIKQSGKLQPQSAVRHALSLCEALQHALNHGILHRDLKPGNVLLGQDGVLRLADLGIADLLGEEPSASTVSGTPAYLAPERVAGEESDHRADIYALGVTLFEMLTGRPPFQAGGIPALLRKQLDEPAPAPHALVPELPLGLSQAVLKLLAKDPNERPASYLEVRELLEPWNEAESLRVGGQTSSVWTSFVSLFKRGDA